MRVFWLILLFINISTLMSPPHNPTLDIFVGMLIGWCAYNLITCED